MASRRKTRSKSSQSSKACCGGIRTTPAPPTITFTPWRRRRTRIAAWHLPVRETLGAMHLVHSDAASAERVFRADLAHNRRNARSLLGLAESLQVQGKFYAAQQVRQQFEQAWKNAQVGLRVETY